MNDLDLIKEFRADVREPDLRQLLATRARLMRTLEETAPRRRPARTQRRWVIATVGAGAGLALAVTLPGVLPEGSPGGAEPAAATALQRAALVATDRPAERMPKAGEYVYTKTKSVRTSFYVPGDGLRNLSFTLRNTREDWVAPDGSGRITEATGKIGFPSSADRAAWLAAGSPDLGQDVHGSAATERFGAGELSFPDLSELPTDPSELQEIIDDGRLPGGNGYHDETFQFVGELLNESYGRPALRAALFQVAARFPGVEYLGEVKDPAGRPGAAVAYTHNGYREELIYDPHTSVLLASKQVLTDPDKIGLEVGPDTAPRTILSGPGDPGTVLDSTVYLKSGVVDSTRETP